MWHPRRTVWYERCRSDGGTLSCARRHRGPTAAHRDGKLGGVAITRVATPGPIVVAANRSAGSWYPRSVPADDTFPRRIPHRDIPAVTLSYMNISIPELQYSLRDRKSRPAGGANYAAEAEIQEPRLEPKRQSPLTLASAKPARFEVTRTAVSQHLTVLKNAGLLTERRLATRRLYRARPEGLAGLRDFLDQMWASSLEVARDLVEADRDAPAVTRQRRDQAAS